MLDENTRYIRPGYVVLIAALPTLISSCRELIIGQSFGQTFWDTIFSFQILGFGFVLGLLSFRCVGYFGAIVFQISHYFWILAGIYTYYFLIKQSSNVDSALFFYIYIRPSSVVMSHNPFAPFIAVQGAFLLVKRHGVFLVGDAGRFDFSVLKVYRLLSILFLMYAFSRCFVTFTVYPWLRYKTFYDALWIVYLVSIILILIVHMICIRFERSKPSTYLGFARVARAPRED